MAQFSNIHFTTGGKATSGSRRRRDATASADQEASASASATPINPNEGTNSHEGTSPNEGTSTNEGANLNEGITTNEGANSNEGTSTNEGTSPNEGSSTNEGTNPNESDSPNEGSSTNEDTSPSEGASPNESSTGSASSETTDTLAEFERLMNSPNSTENCHCDPDCEEVTFEAQVCTAQVHPRYQCQVSKDSFVDNITRPYMDLHQVLILCKGIEYTQFVLG